MPIKKGTLLKYNCPIFKGLNKKKTTKFQIYL